MESPPETIVVRVSEHEHAFIEVLAEMRGMTTSDMVRELIGLEREQTIRPLLRLVSA